MFTEEPVITLEVTVNELLNCRAGTTIKIPATISGKPIPNVTWDFDGTAPTEKKNERHTLPKDSEVGLFIFFQNTQFVQSKPNNTFYISTLQISSSDTTSVVTIPECKLNHSGRYIITANNQAGTKVVKVHVNVLGKHIQNP